MIKKNAITQDQKMTQSRNNHYRNSYAIVYAVSFLFVISRLPMSWGGNRDKNTWHNCWYVRMILGVILLLFKKWPKYEPWTPFLYTHFLDRNHPSSYPPWPAWNIGGQMLQLVLKIHLNISILWFMTIYNIVGFHI